MVDVDIVAIAPDSSPHEVPTVSMPLQPSESIPELRHRIDSAIKGNPHLNGRRVHCQEEGGIIVLHGRVASFFQKQMAQEALKKLDGVERVINELEVDWMASIAVK